MSSQKCLAKGSAAPGPVPSGSIRLYSMRFCPYAQRARLVLIAKGIKHEIVNIHLKEKPEWFLEKNPLGLVPTLETSDGEVVWDSPIVCDYLDEAYPGKKLMPSSPFAKAEQKMMLECFSKIPPYFYNITMQKKNGQDVSGLEAELKEKLSLLNKRLVKKNTKFFGGNSITMIDYMMWPWFERLENLCLKKCCEGVPELMNWKQLMLEDMAVKATMHSVDVHKGFFNSIADGKANYDYGL